MASSSEPSKSNSHSSRSQSPDTRPLMSDFADPDEESQLSSNDPSFKGLTLLEKKCLLVNRDVDAMGMGRYQWYVWSFCGFGYMLDLLWAQAFGLVLSPVQQEFGFGNDKTGSISTAFSIGLTVGAFVWGFVADSAGRQYAFNLTVLLASIFGLCLGAPNSYSPFLLLTVCTGFGIGGNLPIDTTIVLEFIPQNKRFLLALLSVWQPIGVVVCSVIAYVFIPNYSCSPNFSEANPLPSCHNVSQGTACCRKEDNYGWRYLMYTLGIITLSAFFIRTVVFRMKESPKYLVYRGKDEEAIAVLHYVAKINGQKSNLTMETFRSLERIHNYQRDLHDTEEELSDGSRQKTAVEIKSKLKHEADRFKLLFDSVQMARLTLLIWLTYILDYSGFTVAGTYLPRILAIKNGALNLSLDFTYRSYIFIYLPGTLGVALGALLYNAPSFGRKWTMVLSSILMSFSIFFFSRVNSEASNIGLNIMEYFFQSMFNAVLYGWTPEAFPAPVRGTACGIASFWGRLFGIVSPLVAQSLYARSEMEGGDINAVLYLAGSVTLGCVVSVALLPSKSLGTQSM